MNRILALACVLVCASALAQAPDTILFNAQIKKLVGRESRGQDSIVDLKGRTVIPGLIDSHMHAIRAALSFATEVNWIGTKSIADGEIEAVMRVVGGGA